MRRRRPMVDAIASYWEGRFACAFRYAVAVLEERSLVLSGRMTCALSFESAFLSSSFMSGR